MKNIVICGAAGRDFHNFNVLYRHDPSVRVVAFTAAQIPNIDQRRYPPELAGERYPDGIPIRPEAELVQLCLTEDIDEVVFAYSDVSHEDVMQLAGEVIRTGTDFKLDSFVRARIKAQVPVVSVCAVRTGCGKSQIARHLSAAFRRSGYRVALIRHPMPYGDLLAQRVQKFATLKDLDVAQCTIEEREEYEKHIVAGATVYAGVDYHAIVSMAEQESDIIIWDGGNNDGSFVYSDFRIVAVDALRPAQLTSHYPGYSVLLEADLVVINKCDTASREQLAEIERNLAGLVPNVPIVKAKSVITSEPARFEGRVLIVEDGPTITHGGVPYGAGYIAAQRQDNVQVVDPRPFAVGSIEQVFAKYPHIGPVLPAVGYGPRQIAELAETISAAQVDWLVCGTPIDLSHVIDLHAPVVRVTYEYGDMCGTRLLDCVWENFVSVFC